MIDPVEITHNSRDKNIWQALLENRLDFVKKSIEEKLGTPVSIFKKIFSNYKPPANSVILVLARDIMFSDSNKRERPIVLDLREQADEHFAELVRFFICLYSNGHFGPNVEKLATITLNVGRQLAEQVGRRAGNYPAESIQGYVWGNGASVRAWLKLLADFFEEINEIRNRASALQSMLQITASLMSHYPYTIGPDMIMTAEAMEAIEEIDLAKSYYKAVINDFEKFANDIRDNPNEEVWEEQIISMQALKQAYLNLNKLNKENHYEKEIEFINQILAKGVTKAKDEEDEKDEKDDNELDKQ